jgi:hypothetical protein
VTASCSSSPYETFELACDWFDGIKPEEVGLTEKEIMSIARDKAIEVMNIKL